MKHPIHLKIFFSFAAILLLSILITLLFGNQVMERLYIQNKTKDLKAAYQAITETLMQRDCNLTIDEELLDAFFADFRAAANLCTILFTGELAAGQAVAQCTHR